MDAGDASRRVTVKEYGRIGRQRVTGGRLSEKAHDDEGVAERGNPARRGIELCRECRHIERAGADGSENIELESAFSAAVFW